MEKWHEEYWLYQDCAGRCKGQELQRTYLGHPPVTHTTNLRRRGVSTHYRRSHTITPIFQKLNSALECRVKYLRVSSRVTQQLGERVFWALTGQG